MKEDDAEQAEKARSKRVRALIGSEKRLANIARDMVERFEARQEVFSGKGLIVCMSRPIAVNL